ncbi:Beta-D-xylosidase 1 [Striga hermonthica]|uniref:Beta-D-xylosidase 1 n=1 Tax=Striga hermonthica TaxID=68872 RepID=A0A9N7NGL9_STRHE|nr:Beta-D-xylosidase 1 [Striga hermonthica]
MYNGGQAGLTFWSPNVNIFRDPRWGRGQETPGEDPWLTSQYAVSYVRGLQGNDTKNKLKVAACCKHFTAYDLDSWNRVKRYYFNAVVTEQDLEETYNVPFKTCVIEGKVASVMCSYNQVNGKPTCADPSLLGGTIRGQWHLNGYIVSDCDSIDVYYRRQHYTPTPEDAAALALKAGLDLDCGPFLAIHTQGAINAGKLRENDVNHALGNLLTVQMRLGMFDSPEAKYKDLGPKDVCTKAHQQLALEAAHQGIVLLQNNQNLLPLSTKGHHTVTLIGPNSNATQTMIGNYAGIPCAYISPLQGISSYVNKIIHAMGCGDVRCNDTQKFEEAEQAARKADATILVMGLSLDIEREGLDRVDVLLPGHQQELISRVADASKKPVILVLMSGGPVDISFAKYNPKIGAILWVGYPGQSGGLAIADVIYGKFNPGGKLTMTWYPQEYIGNVSMTNMNMHADPKTKYPGRTYRFYYGPTVYSFGYGLSYTCFKHTIAHITTNISIPLISSKAPKNSTLSSKAIRVSRTRCESLSFEVQVDVENQGKMDGHETIMIFASRNGSKKHLAAFEKVHVSKGGKKRVTLNIDVCKHLSFVDRFGIRRISMGEHLLHIGENLKHAIMNSKSAGLVDSSRRTREALRERRREHACCKRWSPGSMGGSRGYGWRTTSRTGCGPRQRGADCCLQLRLAVFVDDGWPVIAGLIVG